jgi:hypothetical protein
MYSSNLSDECNSHLPNSLLESLTGVEFANAARTTNAINTAKRAIMSENVDCRFMN